MNRNEPAVFGGRAGATSGVSTSCFELLVPVPDHGPMARKKRKAKPGPAYEYPVCVRQMKSRKDVRLRHFFLCDRCSAKWTAEAFSDNRPLWQGERLDGYCQLCNARKRVRPRTWYLCDVCWRVAASIGRNHVAEQAIMDWWRDNVEPVYPHLVIGQNDVSSLLPMHERGTSGQAALDFLVRDKKRDRVVFGIENKTGRSSIREMSAFQLDISDCDSMLYHVRKLKIPAYIIHAQVLELWDPPTVGYKSFGLWWTDIYQMAANYKRTRQRRDESRSAAYFGKKAFHDIGDLTGALVAERGQLALVKRFRAEGIPEMYEAG